MQSRYYPRIWLVTDENHKNFSLDRRCPGRNSNLAPAEYKSTVLLLDVSYSICILFVFMFCNLFRIFLTPCYYLTLNIHKSRLTHSLMEPSPSWEPDNCAATQELPSVLWNPKVHYRPHKSPPLVSILSQIDPIPTIPSYLRSILILSTHLRLGLPSGPFPSGFPTNILMHSSFPPFMLHTLSISSSLTWSF
jgi:hypothetical protein